MGHLIVEWSNELEPTVLSGLPQTLKADALVFFSKHRIARHCRFAISFSNRWFGTNFEGPIIFHNESSTMVSEVLGNFGLVKRGVKGRQTVSWFLKSLKLGPC